MDTLAFYVVMGLTYLCSLVVRRRLNLTYSKYSRVPSHAGFSGGQVARDILDSNGLRDVQLELAQGTLTDHYDPRTRMIRLSLGNARGSSVAAMAVSAHEAGHALQDADDYAPLEIRTSILPLVQAGARLGIPLAMAGSVLDSQPMFLLGALAYLASIAFHFITLPVEFGRQPASVGTVEETRYHPRSWRLCGSMISFSFWCGSPEVGVSSEGSAPACS